MEEKYPVDKITEFQSLTMEKKSKFIHATIIDAIAILKTNPKKDSSKTKLDLNLNSNCRPPSPPIFTPVSTPDQKLFKIN